MYHVQKANAIELVAPAGLGERAQGLKRATLVGREVGSVHTGFALVSLEHGGWVATHLHSTEQSFYVLRGHPRLTLDGRTYRLSPDECGLIPLGVPHAWGATDMDLDARKIGAPADAPTVSASMATALLAYSGIALKMLVDQRLGAVLHTMFMVEYEPGGVAQPHDHPLEEAYYVLEGEVDAMADGERFTLQAGDVFWTGVGCIHAFWNNSDRRVRWLETQSPQPPANYSYRFSRDWEHLAERLEEVSSRDIHEEPERP